MLSRVLVFAATLCGLALVVPVVAPLLMARLAPGDGQVAADTAETATNGRRASAPPASARQLALRDDGRGHFVAKATVNGRSIDVLVDTGATVVSLSDETARRLGILPPQSAYTARIATANGEIRAAPVTLSEIRIGGLSVRNVEAVVVPGKALGVNLLGMSFLGRLSKFEIAGGRLLLTQ